MNTIITGDEWLEILRQLERHHALFYRLWEIGMPVFTHRVETAAVHFDRGGDFVQFRFNPAYWQQCTPYDRLFVICHEALHVILNHGVRTRDANDKDACNIALDIVVNHLLIRSFGFDRRLIRNSDSLCWVDTVFGQDEAKLIPDDESFEFYLRLMETSVSQPPGSAGVADTGVRTVDDHACLGEADTSEVMRRVGEALSDEEKRYFEGLFKSLFKPSRAGEAASEGVGGLWHIAKAKVVKPKRKWESVIQHWVRKRMQKAAQDEEQWARRNRRFRMLPDVLFLPSEVEADGFGEKKGRIKVRFYLDTSASCWHLKDRFFEAAQSIPKDKFDVELFCFDIRVVPTDLESRRLCGGGGTSFRILEEDIQRAMTRDQAGGGQGAYPDAVFVVTDGWGDAVKPAKPERWHIFIDGASPWTIQNVVDRYIPASCRVFNLGDFI